jgi:GT2 family glycosyltransferase
VRVSLIVPTYQRPELLCRALRSIASQSRPPDEVLVAAWLGDTATLTALDAFQRETPELAVAMRVIAEPDDSMIAGHNRAIEAATGDVVAFMDDDAEAPEEWLAQLLAWYTDERVGAVGGRDVLSSDTSSDATAIIGKVTWFGRVYGNHHRGAGRARSVQFLKGCNMSFRRCLLRPLDAHLIGRAYGYEIDAGLAVLADGYQIVYDPEAFVHHHATSDMSEWNLDNAHEVNHNQTFVLLKHLRGTRRTVFLLYTLTVGDRGTMGVARALLRPPQGGKSWALARAHVGGTLAGMRTYWRMRGTAPPGEHAVMPVSGESR